MELSKNDTTAIKGIAIILMLWHHLFLYTNAYGDFAQSMAVVFKVCVALFLFVSGYGLTKQYSKLEKPYFKNTVKFLLKRYVNFFLHYWFCFVLVVLVGNLAGLTFEDVYPASRNTLKCFLLDAWGLMGWGSYLSTWWFNKMILQLYLVFPLLYLLVRNKYVALASMVVIAVMQPNALSLPGHVFCVVEGGLPAFFMGMMVSKHQLLPKADGKTKRIVAIIVSVLVVVGLSMLHQSGIKGYYAILIRAVLAVVVIYLYSLTMIGFSPIRYVGQFATTMYLVHTLIQILIPKVVYAPKYPVLIFLLFFFMSLVVAMLNNYLQKLIRYDKLQNFVLDKVNRIL